MTRPAARICCFLLVAGLLFSCQPQDVGPIFRDEDARFSVGLDGARPDSGRTTLSVELHNSGETFDGTIEVAGSSFGRETLPARVRLPLDIPAGERKRLEIPIDSTGMDEVRLRLTQEGYEKSLQWTLPSLIPRRSRVLVVGENVPAMTPFADSVLACLEKTTIGEQDEAVAVPANVQEFAPSCKVTKTRAERLSAIPDSLAPYDLIVLWGTSLTSAPPGAVAALRRWVEHGGSLVVFPGAEWLWGIPPELQELLGAAVGDGTTETPSGIADTVGGPDLELEYWPLWPKSPAATADWLSVLAPLGAGRVHTFSVRPQGDEFPAAEKAPGLWDSLRPTIVRSLTFAGSPEEGLVATEAVVAGQLFRMTNFTVPHVVLVGFGLFLYLGVGFVLPAIVLRRRRRRELIYVWGLGVAGLVTFGIWRLGVLSSVPGLELAEVSIARPHSGGSAWEVTSFLGAISPRPGELQLQDPKALRELPPVRSPRARPLLGFLGRYAYRLTEIRHPATPIAADLAGRQWLEPLRLRTNGLRCVRVDHVVEAPPLAVRFERVKDGARPVGQLVVENSTSRPVEVLFAHSGLVARFAVVQPGARVVATADELRSRSHHPVALSAFDNLYDYYDGGVTHRFGLETPGDDILSNVLRGLYRSARDSASQWEAYGSANFRSMQFPGFRFPIASALQEHEPQYVILVSQQPLFEPAQSVPHHRAWSFIVVEIPPESQNQ